MEQTLLKLLQNACDHSEEAQISTDAIVESVARADERAVRALIAKVKQMVKATSVNPSRKYLAFRIICECMQKDLPVFRRVLSSKFLSRLTVLAQHHREMQEIARGASLFGPWGQMVEEAEASIRFFRLLLVSVRDWALRFPYSKPGTYSKFYRAYEKLKALGVCFPMEFDVGEIEDEVKSLISLLQDKGNREEIENRMGKLPDWRGKLYVSLQKTTDLSVKTRIEDCVELITSAESLYREREVARIAEKVQEPGEHPQFPLISEPTPMEEPERVWEERAESEGDEDDLERSDWDSDISVEEQNSQGKIQVLDAELQIVELTVTCNRYKEEMRRLEARNRNLEQCVEDLKKELSIAREESQAKRQQDSARSSLSACSRPSLPASPSYPIANKSNCQLLLPLSKGTLYSDKYCDVLFTSKLEDKANEFCGAFMIVIRSSSTEVTQTAVLQTIETPGFYCKPAKELNRSELMQKQESNAQFRFRYTEVTHVTPVFSLSFISAGLRFMYYFELPIQILKFAKGVSDELSTISSLWSDMREHITEASLPSFDPLIQNVSQLSDRIRYNPHINLFSGQPLPPGRTVFAASIRGESVLARLTVAPERSLKLEVAVRSPKLRAMALQVLIQSLEP